MRVAAVRQGREQRRDLQGGALVARLERALPRFGEVRIGLDRFGGRGQQDGQPVGGHPGPQLDQAADVPQPQPDRGLRGRDLLGPVHQGPHAGAIRAVPGGVGRGGQPAGPVRVGRVELGGPFQRGGGRAVSAAPQRPHRRPLELGRRPLVRAGGRPGQVPGPAVVLLPVGQGGVRGSPFGRAGLVIHGRTDQPVREHHGRSLDPDQAVQAFEPGRVQAEGGGRRGDGGQPPGTSAQQRQRASLAMALAAAVALFCYLAAIFALGGRGGE